jgi:hypothetical protein
MPARGRSVLSRAVAVLIAALPAVAARAGSISISTEVVATARERTLSVALNITNSGDEAAVSVVAQAEFEGAAVHTEPRPRLRPGERMEATLELPRGQSTPGQWPLVTRVDYADAKGYPFQAVQVAVVSVLASPSLVAIVDVEAAPVAGSGSLRARLKSLSDAPRAVQIRLLAPRGLEVDPPAASLSMEPWGEAAVGATIVNRAALVGSRYPVFVTAEYDEAGVHHTAVGQAMAVIEAAGHRPRYAIMAAVALLVAWLALLAWRRLQRGRRVSAGGPGGPAPPRSG